MRRDCIALPTQEAQHPEAEAPTLDRNVFFSVFSPERREENSSGYLNVCSILQQGFLLTQRVGIVESRGRTSGSVWSNSLNVKCARWRGWWARRGCQPHLWWCSVASSTWQCHTQANQISPDKQKKSFGRVMGNPVEVWRIVGCHNRLRELLQVTSCDVKETSAAP